ncbi:MAG: hypothetical protein DMF73_03780 [Acidobacteria bacterium]|nr:MAG: hypothetical protein DMF73_03780 [Acidobacteriota bacterium]
MKSFLHKLLDSTRAMRLFEDRLGGLRKDFSAESIDKQRRSIVMHDSVAMERIRLCAADAVKESLSLVFTHHSAQFSTQPFDLCQLLLDALKQRSLRFDPFVDQESSRFWAGAEHAGLDLWRISRAQSCG